MGSIGSRPSGRAWIWGILGALLVLCPAPGQIPRGPLFGLPVLPDRAAGRTLLEQFRQSMNAQPFYLEFELRALPRRGDERVYRGRMWGARDGQGPVTRITLDGADGRPRRFIVRSGTAAGIWRSDNGSAGVSDPGLMMTALVPGVETTAFDLQMPFLYWPDAALEKVERVRGRAAYVFLFHPPADFVAAYPGVTAVRAYLDADYNALVQFELLGRDGRVAKTWSLLDLKKIEGKWIVKEVDVRNEETRDKTRFLATAAALNVTLPAGVFEPARLGSDPGPVGRIVTLGP